MTTTHTPQKAQPAETQPAKTQPAETQPAIAEMRTRRASEVFRILDPSPVKPIAATPIGLWNTGWLPKPQGAAS